MTFPSTRRSPVSAAHLIHLSVPTTRGRAYIGKYVCYLCTCTTTGYTSVGCAYLHCAHQVARLIRELYDSRDQRLFLSCLQSVSEIVFLKRHCVFVLLGSPPPPIAGSVRTPVPTEHMQTRHNCMHPPSLLCLLSLSMLQSPVPICAFQSDLRSSFSLRFCL